MKTCSTCKVPKFLSEFGRLTSSRDGLNRRCKVCMRESNRRYEQTKGPSSRKSKRESWLRSKYGITSDEYENLVFQQGDKCGICSSNNKGRNRGYWCVDHDHTTGKVRGLLCSTCNKALGQLGDTVESLQRAINYLSKTNDTH